MKIVALPNPALHLSEAEPPYVRVVEESGEWRPDVPSRALRMMGGGGAGEGEEASSETAAALLNEGTNISKVKTVFQQLQKTLDASKEDDDNGGGVEINPAEAKQTCNALSLLTEKLEGAYQKEMEHAILWGGATAAAVGDFDSDTLARLAAAGSERALEELLKNDPGHPRVKTMLERWVSSPHPDHPMRRPFNLRPIVSRFPQPSNPRLWEAAGVNRREAALNGTLRAAIGAWLGVNHLEYRPELFARLAYRAPIWAVRMLRCAQKPEHLEEAARVSAGDVREVALSHLGYLRGEPSIRRIRWPIRTKGVPWVPLFLSSGGAEGAGNVYQTYPEGTGAVFAASRQWNSGAAWLRFGEDAIWAADCRCTCGNSRGEYMLPPSPEAKERMKHIFSLPCGGEWERPPLLKSRYVKPNGTHYRIWVEDPSGYLREGMCVETEHHAERGRSVLREGRISYEVVLTTEQGKDGSYGEFFRTES